ncbi:MAG: N-acetyltransferase, partial [Candidatus Sumerlaeota bacterium]
MSDDALVIKPVRNDRMMALFIDIPFRIYAKTDHWVPQPRMAMRDLLNRKKHPFHEHAQVEYFLAFRGRECVGRIAAVENFAHNQYHDEKIGFFGFLDAYADAEVVRVLLAEAEQWCKARGLVAMRGPCSFSTNEECGALVMGFDALPTVMMTWNPESYPRHIEAAGYAKAKDLFSWWVDEDNYDERLHRIADRVRDKIAGRDKKVHVVCRCVDMKNFAAELELVRKVYNAAWEKNWGFVP